MMMEKINFTNITNTNQNNQSNNIIYPNENIILFDDNDYEMNAILDPKKYNKKEFDKIMIQMKEKRRRVIMAVICALIILSMVLAMLAPMFT